jgi:DNA-3-methyladenine glycosylase II
VASRAVADLAAEFAALAALEPAFGQAMDRYGTPERELAAVPRDAAARYALLVRAIVSQQLSTKAAATIHGRLLALLGPGPTPEAVLGADTPALRAVGLSGAKARAVQGVAMAMAAGDIDLEALDDLDDDAALEALVTLPGVGPWTAQMFLMFSLRRPDVLAAADIGVLNGVRAILGLETRPTPKELVLLAEPWRPHRTAACLVAWWVLTATPLGA